MAVLTVNELGWRPDDPLSEVEPPSQLYGLTGEAGAGLVLHLTRHNQAGSDTEWTEYYLQCLVLVTGV